MNSLRTLRDAIVAEPDDLGLRRVYADALLERGDPRGQFIHVQLQLEVNRTPELEAAEAALLERYRHHWALPVRPDHHGVKFVRGFVEEWTCSLDELLNRGKRVLKATPLRLLRLACVTQTEVFQLPRSLALRNVRELELDGLRAWPFVELSRVKFERLERLVLRGDPGGASYGFHELLGAPWFPRLKELEVRLPIAKELRDRVQHLAPSNGRARA
ncbi:MAG: TIGR02996 domain-containing protein [Myxococcaceae bacterium]|nr:TIGR02996 domain-containing protein [Myxococcaceae bacterium]